MKTRLLPSDTLSGPVVAVSALRPRSDPLLVEHGNGKTPGAVVVLSIGNCYRSMLRRLISPILLVADRPLSADWRSLPPSPETRPAFYQHGAGPTTPATSRRNAPTSGWMLWLKNPAFATIMSRQAARLTPHTETFEPRPEVRGTAPDRPGAGAEDRLGRQPGMTRWNVGNGSPRPA